MRRLLIIAVAVASLFACAAAAPKVTVTVGHSTLRIPCGTGVQAPVDWYMPAGPPTGLVWLQHGWLGSKEDIAPLAQAIAANTGAMVVAPTVSSWPWEQGTCWIEGEPLERAVASLFQGDRAALAASARAVGWTGPLPSAFVLAGHSAGGDLALQSAADLVGTPAFANFKGDVLLDGGTNSNTAFPSDLAAVAVLSGRPIYQVAAPSGVGPSNDTSALLAQRPGEFVGVYLVNGTHLDAAGYTNLLSFLVWPRLENVAAVQRIASDWIHDLLAGDQAGIVAGAPGQQFPVGAATAVVLG